MGEQFGTLNQVARASEEITVNRDDIEEVVASWTGIPVTSIKEDEADRLRRMEELLRQRVVGQDDSIEALSRAIRRSRRLPARSTVLTSYVTRTIIIYFQKNLSKCLTIYYLYLEYSF